MKNDKPIYMLTNRKNEAYVLKTYLKNEGLELSLIADEESFIKKIGEAASELLILDEQSLGEDWVAALKRIRLRTSAIIFMLMASDDVMVRITALSVGADLAFRSDTMTLEFVAYIKSLIRRTRREEIKRVLPEEMSFGDIRILRQEHAAVINGSPASLTPNEFEFLSYMIQSKKAVSKEELLREIWKTEDKYLMTHVTEDLVKRLRKKLKKYGSRVRIEAVWGYGYRLSEGGEPDDKESRRGHRPSGGGKARDIEPSDGLRVMGGEQPCLKFKRSFLDRSCHDGLMPELNISA